MPIQFPHPIRIQRKRSKGWRWPEGAVYVGRPTPFGNPFTVTEKLAPGKMIGARYFAVPTIEDAIACYREYLDQKPELVERIRSELRGKNLMCWCPLNQRCHADLLLEIANS